MLVYSGPSMLTGDPIAGIVTGIGARSRNAKTGAMAQLWILPRMHPVRATQTGQDDRVCGACPLRGRGQRRACYVVVANAPLAVWRRWRRQGYPRRSPESVGRLLGDQPIRLGAYGDPAALPLDVLRGLTVVAPWTGYTHQWRTCDPAYAGWLMASVETDPAARQARAAGWRTFRATPGPVATTATEIICPASAEGGHRATCAECGLCSGMARPGARSIVIGAHGSGVRLYWPGGHADHA